MVQWRGSIPSTHAWNGAKRTPLHHRIPFTLADSGIWKQRNAILHDTARCAGHYTIIITEPLEAVRLAVRALAHIDVFLQLSGTADVGRNDELAAGWERPAARYGIGCIILVVSDGGRDAKDCNKRGDG